MRSIRKHSVSWATAWIILVTVLHGNAALADWDDFLTLTSVSDGNPATDDRGWANSHINAVPFKTQSLTTVGDYQFTSYYGADSKLVVGRRNLATNPDTWDLLHTEFTSFNINDAHNTSSMAIDGDGYLHIAWGVHNNPLPYTRSTTSVLNDDPFHLVGETVGNSGSITGALPLQGNSITYPEFYNLPDSGDVLLSYRTGSSGNGEYQLARWNDATNAWTSVHTALNSGNSGPQPWIDNDYSGDSLPNVNAYPNKIVADSNGRLHVTWTWRTGSDSLGGFSGYQTNHNLMYAYSDNGGVDWYRDDGTLYQYNGVHDIDENNAIPVVTIPEGSSYINTTTPTIGPDGTYYLAASWAPEADQGNHLRQIMLVEYDGQQWETHQVSQRNPEFGNNPIPESQLRDFPLRRPIVLADDDDRVFVVYGDYQRGGGVTLAYSESASRDDWTFIDLTTENLGTWSPTYDANRWANDGVLSLYYQPMGLGQMASTVSVLEWDARAYFDSLNPHPGDFDGDGDVDGADFVIWQTNFPTASGATLATGDADGDGDVDGADFVIWQTNFPTTPSPGASAVPEPEAMGLLIAGLAVLASSRRRFRTISAALCVGGMLFGPRPTVKAELVARESFDYPRGDMAKADGGFGWEDAQSWKTPPGESQYVCDENLTYALDEGRSLGRGRATAIHGIGDRSNPLRRPLKSPYTGDSLYIRFLIQYDAASIDDEGSNGDGEFFVLWLDDIDGGDGANHNPSVPNIGINVRDNKHPTADGKNYFMVRMNHEKTAFSDVELEGDRTYLLVARLSKTQPGALSVYDRLELWVDPDPNVAQPPPQAVAHGRSFNSIRWVGFSTGKKTEPGDFVLIDELALGERWEDVIPGGIGRPTREADLPQPADVASSPDRVDFRRDVYPILREHCFDCHQGRDAESGHRLDVREEILGHYQGHPLAIPNDSKNSRLLQLLVTDDEEKRMPWGGDPLPEQQIAVLRSWIDQGLDWDEKLLPSAPPEIDHWSFHAVKRPGVPRVQGSGFRVQGSGNSQFSGRANGPPNLRDTRPPVDQNPIDAFIAVKHRELGLKPAPPADRRTLLRRVTLDLTGLPPTPKEIEAFLADESPDAVRKVVDRLLASSAYGERWGRHWLDLARWAESDGHQHNYKRAHAWRYRDYVVQSFAQNKPYNRFVREQVAGDELLPYSDENLIATGFLAAARYSDNEMDKATQRNDILVDVANTTANTLLGMTMQCAQCHSHKFDPISARDYYRFMGFFVKGQPQELLLRGDESSPKLPDEQAVLEAIDEQYQILAASRTKFEAEQRMKGLPNIVTTNDVVGRIPPEQKKRFQELEKLIAGHERTWGYYSPATSPTRIGAPYLKTTSPLTYSLHMLQRAKPVLYVRGDVDSPGPEVDVGWPAVFGPAPDDGRIEAQPRAALADWLTDRQNPLTARVWVNRLWLYHFGRGLVPTPDDFGLQGEEPTHPQLLDWLAAELMESGWNTGHIQRLIVESATYRQSSQLNEAFAQIDPENQFYWRWMRRRLEAEAIRDSMLAVAGLLDGTVGGPSVPLAERDDSTRRTLYLEQKRGDLPFVQQLFDAPSTLTCCGRRRNSTVALQPLFLLNDTKIYQYAEAFAKRVLHEAGDDRQQQAERAFELALGRLPRDTEKGKVLDFLGRSETAPPRSQTDAPDKKSPAPDENLIHFCHSLMNLNEFLYIP